MNELFDDGKQDAVKMESEVPAIVPQEMNSDDRLMETVIKTGNIEALERYIALRERTEARQAKLEYDRHFAEMQAEFGTAQRTKKGYNYKYAPIESLQKEFGKIISKHGFSYKWREEAIETGKRVILTISGWGHIEENYFDVPKIDGTKENNAIQVAGIMSTYGRRYTFIAGFGIIIEDEDMDGALTFNDGVMYSDNAIELRKCATLEELAKEFKKQYDALSGDNIGRQIITKVKDECKKKLSEVKK